MKILKKYANGGSTKKDDSRKRPIGPGGKPPEKEKGNPFNTGTGSKFRKLANRMKKRQGPAEGRKYMGGGKMKEYGHGGKMKYENGGTMGRAPGGQRDERQKEAMRKRLSGKTDNPGRGGVRGMDKDRMEEMQKRRRMRKRMRSARLMKGAAKGAAQMGARAGARSMEDGGVNPKSDKPSRFAKKFARKRKKYEKDVKKGRTQEMPHKRTFKFRKKGDSIFKKRGKFNVETRGEKSERMAHMKSRGKYHDTIIPDTPDTKPVEAEDTPSRRVRIPNRKPNRPKRRIETRRKA